MSERTSTEKNAIATLAPRLPDDILLLIFSSLFANDHEKDAATTKWTLKAANEHRRTLFNLRLTCRAFNEIVTPLLYRKLAFNLSAESLRHLQLLAANPLVRRSIRGITISLGFHARVLASDIKTFHRSQALPVIDKAEGECDWHTEFAEYGPEDQSEDAKKVRAYHAVWPKLCAINYNWKKYIKRLSQLEKHTAELFVSQTAAHEDADGTEAVDDVNADETEVHEDAEDANEEYDEMECWGDSDGDDEYDEHTKILVKGYEAFVAQHTEERRMIEDQSFAQTIASVLSGNTSPISIHFHSRDFDDSRDGCGALEIADNHALIESCISGPKEWVDIESLTGADAEEDLLMPARLLADVPIACHEAGVRIKTFGIDCFPLNKSFKSLIPSHARGDAAGTNADQWSRFAAALQNLTTFDFGSGNCTPIRPERLQGENVAIMNGFITAGNASSQLERCKVTLGHYKVTTGSSMFSYSRGAAPKIEQFYLGGSVLESITSRELRDLTIMYVEVSAAALQNALRGIVPAQLHFLYLCDVVLTDGRWLDVMDELHEAMAARPRDGTKPRVIFTGLRGIELGAAEEFQGGDPFFSASEEERESYWDKLEEHQHPAMLKAVQEWVTEDRGEAPNPLAVIWEKKEKK